MRTILPHLAQVLPWLAFGVLSPAGWQWGALTGLAVSVVLLLREHRAGVPADALILLHSTTCYFALLTAVSFTVPASPLRDCTGALPFAWLALTAWASILTGYPFTLGIARRRVPAEMARTPQFIRFTTMISTVWATAFTANAVTSTLCIVTHAGTPAMTAAQAAGLATAGTITYVAARRRRRTRPVGTAAPL